MVMGDGSQRKKRTTRPARESGAGKPPLIPVRASDVDDNPTQILDVVTLSEQEEEHRGAEIELARYVYEPADVSLGDSVLDEILASEPGVTTDRRKGESD